MWQSLIKNLCALILVLGAVGQSWAQPGGLSVQVFNGGTHGYDFAANSAIVLGEKEAVLIDAQFSLSSAHRLVADILETGRYLKQIYITHWHPDHFLGLEVITDAFPRARVLAIPLVAKEINGPYYDFKIRYWGKFLGNNGPSKRVPVETVHEAYLELEGHRLEIVGPMQGDMPDSTAIWIPSIRTLIAGDVVYTHTHVWLLHAKEQRQRDEWFQVLDRLETLDPLMVIPGHATSDRQTSPESIAFTRDYIKAFQEEQKKAAGSDALKQAMDQRFPGLGLPIINDFNARAFKEGWIWDGDWPQPESVHGH